MLNAQRSFAVRCGFLGLAISISRIKTSKCEENKFLICTTNLSDPKRGTLNTERIPPPFSRTPTSKIPVFYNQHQVGGRLSRPDVALPLIVQPEKIQYQKWECD